MSVFPCCAKANSEEEIDSNISLILGYRPSVTVVILGADGVGKSSLVTRLVNDSFSDHPEPSNEDLHRKEVTIDGKTVTLNIYDTTSRPKCHAMQQQWLSKADVFLLAYAITSKSTFIEMENIRYKLLKIRQNIDANSTVPMVVVGTKCDLSHIRQISTDEAVSFCKMINVSFFETSAKKPININECFHQCLSQYLSFKTAHIKSKNELKHKQIASTNADDTDIHIAVIGTHNVGKHSMIHSYIGGFANARKKRDVYYTSVDTQQSKLELILNVYCIEYKETETQIQAEAAESGINININPSPDNSMINAQKAYDKRIVTPSHSHIPSHHANASNMTMIELDSIINETEMDENYFDALCNDCDFDYDETHTLNIRDITKNNDAFLFVTSIDDKQSFVQCIDLIKNIKNDVDGYNYSKPVIIVVTKCDLSPQKHQLTEGDIAEFAVDICSPFLLTSPDDFKTPFNRAIAAIRGYCTPLAFMCMNDAAQQCHAMAQSLNGKYLYCGYWNGSIRIWDIETCICIAIVAYHSERIYKIKEHWITLRRQWWKPCKYLITCAGDLCCAWLLFGKAATDDFYGIVNAENVVNNHNKPLYINCPRFVFKHEARIRSFCICNSNTLCTVGDDKKMKLWSLIDGKLLYDSGQQQLDVLNQVVYVKEYDKLFVAASNNCVYSWEMRKALAGTLGIQLTGGHYNNVNDLKVCRKSSTEIYVISLDDSGYIRCRSAESPHHIYWDYFRHNGAVNACTICKLNRKKYVIGNYDYILCTASQDGTVRGYSIPDGEVVFNICDTFQALSAIDCNQNFITVAGKDNYVRCYELMSNNIQYSFRRYKINNNLRISLSWAYHRHTKCLNAILCGKKQFKHMVFSCDKRGVILGWNMNNGQCMACFGSEMSRVMMVKDAKHSPNIDMMTKVIQFLQLLTLICNESYNPLSLCTNIFQFDFYPFFSHIITIPFEWMFCMLFLAAFFVLFCVSPQLKYVTRANRDRFNTILAFFGWVTMNVAFIPILRNILGVFVCNHMSKYLVNGRNACWSSISHWFYVTVSVIVLVLYLPTVYRLQYRCNDLRQINTSEWIAWNKDYPQHNRVHFTSQTTTKTAPIYTTIVVVMVAMSFSSDIYVFIVCALALCVLTLFVPPFYFRNMNIFDCSLYFGVLWTYLCALFVSQIDTHYITIIHFSLLSPFMLFGAVLMWLRVHINWYDEIRGDFRKILAKKSIGIISEDINYNNLEVSVSGVIRAENNNNAPIIAENNDINDNKSAEYDDLNEQIISAAQEQHAHKSPVIKSSEFGLIPYKITETVNRRKRNRIDTNSTEVSIHHNSIEIKVQNSLPLNPLSEEDAALLSLETSVEATETEINYSDETSPSHTDKTENGEVDTHIGIVVDCDMLLDANTDGIVTDNDSSYVDIEEAKDKFDTDLSKISQSIMQRKLSSDTVRRKMSEECSSKYNYLNISLKTIQNESSFSEFDYYASINQHEVPVSSVLHGSNKSASDVTEFSGMDEVPQNIAAHLF